MSLVAGRSFENCGQLGPTRELRTAFLLLLLSVAHVATQPYWSAMDIKKALRTVESKELSEVARGQAERSARGQAESGNVNTSPEELAALLRLVSEAPTREIENLINKLQTLRVQLQNASDRIQRDIAQYAKLSQQTMQLAAIVSDTLKRITR